MRSKDVMWGIPVGLWLGLCVYPTLLMLWLDQQNPFTPIPKPLNEFRPDSSSMLPSESACMQTFTLADWILQGFIPVNAAPNPTAGTDSP